MYALVTGGTGFVGCHLVRALLARGARVRCLVRTSSPLDNLEELDVEVVIGDLRDRAAVTAAVDGCDTAFHCAADYRLYVRRPESMYAANVEGTRNVLRAAADDAVERVVYSSTVGALGLAAGEAADETTPVTFGDMIGHYKRSKFQAERVADEWAGRGLPVVIVNPSTPVGERDIKPTATGQVIVDFLNRKIPAYVDTGLNWVDVRDVAEGHVLAAEKGRVGEKYILGHRNLTLVELFGVLSGLTGLPAPRRRLPHWIPIAFAAVDTGVAQLFGRTPRVSLESERLARYKMFFDPAKAVRELGMSQTPIEEPLARAVEWFRNNGYVGRAGRRKAGAPGGWQ